MGHGVTEENNKKKLQFCWLMIDSYGLIHESHRSLAGKKHVLEVHCLNVTSEKSRVICYT